MEIENPGFGRKEEGRGQKRLMHFKCDERKTKKNLCFFFFIQTQKTQFIEGYNMHLYHSQTRTQSTPAVQKAGNSKSL